MSLRRRGFTLIELVIVIAITAILAAAFVGLVYPTMNFFLYFPQSTKVNNTAADLMKIILQGDHEAKGLRYAGPACKIGGAGGGGSGITTASTLGTVSTLTYNYADSDYCGSGAPRLSRTVTLSYDSSTGMVTRSIDGGTPKTIPYYTQGSDIRFQPASGAGNIFRYYGVGGVDLGEDPLAVSINYVKSLGTSSLKSAGTSLALNLSAGAAQGNLVVISFVIDGISGTISASDTKGNAYAVAGNAQLASPGTGNVRTTVLYSVLSNALEAGDVITVTHPSRTAKAMSVDEYTGVNTLDAATSASGGSGTAVSTGNVTTGNDDELLVTAFGVEGDVLESFTIGGSFVDAPPQESGTTGGTATTNATVNPAYQIVNAQGTYSASATLGVSTASARVLAAFFNSPIKRIDVDFIAVRGSGDVQHSGAQIHLRSGVQVKQYSTG